MPVKIDIISLNIHVYKHFFFFLWLHLWLMEIPRLGGQIGAAAIAYATVPQHQILNPLSEARNQTCILMDTN